MSHHYDFSPASVYLVRNPWPTTVPDDMLMRFLTGAASLAQMQLRNWAAAGEIVLGRESFAAVLLDPTKPRGANCIADLVMAIIMIGPNAERYIPNGASKGDGHDRHGRNMGELVNDFNHLLADGEFAFGDSAEYDGAIGGGSGQKVKQDGDLVMLMLARVIDNVRAVRKQYVEEQRRLNGGPRWLSTDDQPAQQYADVIGLIHLPTTLTAAV